LELSRVMSALCQKQTFCAAILNALVVAAVAVVGVVAAV
jgi:hypothetical protein